MKNSILIPEKSEPSFPQIDEISPSISFDRNEMFPSFDEDCSFENQEDVWKTYEVSTIQLDKIIAEECMISKNLETNMKSDPEAVDLQACFIDNLVSHVATNTALEKHNSINPGKESREPLKDYPVNFENVPNFRSPEKPLIFMEEPKARPSLFDKFLISSVPSVENTSEEEIPMNIPMKARIKTEKQKRSHGNAKITNKVSYDMVEQSLTQITNQKYSPK